MKQWQGKQTGNVREVGKREKHGKWDLVFLSSFFLIGIFLFWKCRYGFGNRDEAFYLTIPYRLSQGDALFSEEWHLSQMAGLLTFPFVRLYLWIVGSTEGIILAFRYICTAVWCAGGLFFYFRLKKYSRVGAGIAVICFLLYIPFGIMALSYNSLGILNLLISLTMAGTAVSHRRGQFFFSGIFFSAAVLCCPYLTFVYLIYSAFVWLPGAGERKNILWGDRERWFFFSAGIFFSALLFLLFVFSRTSPEKILAAFPFIFQDPQHPAVSVWESGIDYFRAILFFNKAAPLIYPGLLLLFGVLVADKRRMARRTVYLTAAAGGTAALLISVLIEKPYLNFLMFPVNILGLYCRCFSREPRVKKLFHTFWIPGMLYSFCISLSSNQRFYAISSASAVAAVGSILIIVLTGEEIRRDGKGLETAKEGEKPEPDKKKRRGGDFLTVIFLLVLTIQIVSEAVLRYNSVFWEKSMADQTWLLREGPEAGLYVTGDKAYLYETMQRDTEVIFASPEVESVLFLSRTTWLYLLGNVRFGTYSAWLSGVNERTMERLEAYYEINSGKMPDVVYADEEYEEEADWWCSRYGYRKRRMIRGFMLWKVSDFAKAGFPEKENDMR